MPGRKKRRCHDSGEVLQIGGVCPQRPMSPPGMHCSDRSLLRHTPLQSCNWHPGAVNATTCQACHSRPKCHERASPRCPAGITPQLKQSPGSSPPLLGRGLGREGPSGTVGEEGLMGSLQCSCRPFLKTSRVQTGQGRLLHLASERAFCSQTGEGNTKERSSTIPVLEAIHPEPSGMSALPHGSIRRVHLPYHHP